MSKQLPARWADTNLLHDFRDAGADDFLRLYYTTDHLGSVRELVDGGGTVRACYEYAPYGERTKVAGDVEGDFGFTGHYTHAASGIILAPYRGYDPIAGRWLSRDPIGEEGGINLYGYVGNGPVSALDLLGLERYEYDGQGLHVHAKGLTYRVHPNDTGGVAFTSKPGHEKEFNVEKARGNFSKNARCPEEFGKMRAAVSDYWERAADKAGVARIGRNLRRARSALISIGMAGCALALNPDDKEANALKYAVQSIRETIEAGQKPESDQTLDLTLAVQGVYNNNILSGIVWSKLTEK